MTIDGMIIFATFAIASEAMSIEHLNTLILASPKNNIKQSCGRIKRKYDPNFKPLIIDVADQLKGFQGSNMRRLGFYMENKNKI